MTKTREELAALYGISPVTLWRRIKASVPNPSSRTVLLPADLQHIYDYLGCPYGEPPKYSMPTSRGGGKILNWKKQSLSQK